MRIPIAVSLDSRDGGVDRDAKVVNGIIEAEGDSASIRVRPGLSDLGLVKAGVAQLLYAWNGVNTVQGDYLNRGTLATIISGPTSTNLTPQVAGDYFYAQETGPSAATPLLMLKNQSQAWTINKAGTKSDVTFGGSMVGETFPVTSITRSGSVATATMASDPRYNVGDNVTVAGAAQAEYNGAHVITAITAGDYAPERVVQITITRSGTTATATSLTSHGLTTATAYTIAGANDSAYNGAKTITVTSPTTFTFTVTVTAMASPATGTPVISPLTFIGSLDNYAGTDRTKFVAVISRFTGSGYEAPYGFASGSTIVVRAALFGYVDTAATVTSIDVYSDNWAVHFTVAGITSYMSQSSGAEVIVTPPAVTSITYSSTTATCTTTSAHNLVNTNTISISGAVQSGYNGTFSITKTGANTFTYPITPVSTPYSPAMGTITVTDPAVTTNYQFTYAVTGTPATPATGTLTVVWTVGAAGQGRTVPGIAYINGYFAVMDVNGVIWNSALDDPTSWNALAFTTAQNEIGKGAAIAKSQNYLVALKEWSSEFFYDAKNATGSPFSPVENAFTQTGCASGYSVAAIDGMIFWISQGHGVGRSVHVMQGMTQQKVSTPAVDRVLNADDLSSVHAYTLRLDGSRLYILTLVNSDITLAFDIDAKMWTQWSSLTPGRPQTALLLTGTSTAGDAYVSQEIYNTAIAVQTGHVIEYEVFIPTDSVAATNLADGGLQLQFSDASIFNSSNDADGFSFPNPQVGFDAYARGRWHKRSASLNAQADLSITSVRLTSNSDAVGVHKAYYRNIKVGPYIPSAPVPTTVIYAESGAPSTNSTIISALTSGISCAEGSLRGSAGIASITWADNLATVTTEAAHHIDDGAAVNISGVGDNRFNGSFIATYVSPTVFTFPVLVEASSTSPPSPSQTGIMTATLYTESYFKFTKAARFEGTDLLLHESDGHLYAFAATLHQDDGVPISLFIRTTRLDGGTTDPKKLAHVIVIGDRTASTAMLRWSDDDSESFSAYRPVDLSLARPMLRRCGAFDRRSIELKHIGNSALKLSALEMEIGG